jgi:hypothetical protein
VSRLYVVVEGHTERAFIERMLAPHLDTRGVYTTAIVVTTRRDRSTGQKTGRGGGHWKHWLDELRRLVRQDRREDVRLTTLFDLYGLPDDFPELSIHATVRDTVKRADLLERAMAAAVGDRRFLPYLQRHEVEALVLACLDELHEVMTMTADARGITALRQEIGHLLPEDVDDGPATAPSKRLVANIPGYSKIRHGIDALELAGLAKIRGACPRFDAWVTRLEQLGA